jgi:hypothetical protein
MIKTENVINLRLLSHPVNWFVVWTVLLFGGIAWHLIRSGATTVPAASTRFQTLGD